MKIVGTIVEYNPLHTGHIYAIEEIKKQSQADVLVAVISGNFTMRGDLSLFDKFEKTRQALRAGIDLVIELPFVCAVQNADFFANNAIQLLHLAHVSEVWIGSEANNPSLYDAYYQKWLEPESQKKIKELIALGKSYKEATASIIQLSSNDILGFSYYKAIQKNNLPISLHTIKRIGSFDSLKAEQFASAYAIRSDLSLMNTYCPPYVQSKFIRDKTLLFPFLKYQIMNSSINDLRNIGFVEEGLEHKVKEIFAFASIDAFVEYLSTKRYTKSRIQRMLAYILFNIKKDDIPTDLNFLRILGYSRMGQAHLGSIKKKASIFTNIKEGLHPILDIEIKISKIMDIIYSSSLMKKEQGKPIEKD